MQNYRTVYWKFYLKLKMHESLGILTSLYISKTITSKKCSFSIGIIHLYALKCAIAKSQQSLHDDILVNSTRKRNFHLAYL